MSAFPEPWRGIARIIARLNVGGPAIQAILLTEAFRGRGYNSVLIAGQVTPGEAAMDYLAEEHAVNIVSISALSRRLSFVRDLLSLLHLVRILRRCQPAVVHTHTAKAGTLGRLAAMLVGVPVRVHTFHGHVFDGYFSPLLSRAFVRIERCLARHTDCIIAISESQKRELVGRYQIAPPQKIAIVPLGFDLAPFLQIHQRDDNIHRALACSPSIPLVGWVGRFTAIKDPSLFLECAKLLQDIAARFVMVGGGELFPECEQRIRQERLQGSVALLGWQRDLPRIYGGLEMVVCTSISEGTPVALIEAMASGRAIVSTDVGGVRDLMAGRPKTVDGTEVFNNGILVKRDAQLLARAVRYLLDNRERCRAMGEAGREFVRNRFSLQRLADDLESLYLQLAQTKQLHPRESRSAWKTASLLPARTR